MFLMFMLNVYVADVSKTFLSHMESLSIIDVMYPIETPPQASRNYPSFNHRSLVI